MPKASLEEMRSLTTQWRSKFESVLDEELAHQELFCLTGGVDEDNLTANDQKIFLEEENFEATFDNPFETTVEQWSDASDLRKQQRNKRREMTLSLGQQKPFSLASGVP